jgi:eukaryotic-like serine/threonine-protein kinase
MTETATQWVGHVVDGKYQLGPFVGATEHSAVFVTESRQPEVRKAVIKLVPADTVETAGQLTRWRQASKLSHPNLLRILDLGRCDLDGTGVLYVVMECADENLASVVAKRPIAVEEARDILGPLVEALGYIHGQGFVHGHIKPANILALDEQLKISSDGLCRIGDSGGSLSKPSSYDSPEAAGGRISPAGDVWSLGMTLSEALTQRLPVWERTNQGDPAPPATMPAEFLEIARHCLRRDPQLRWSVADIAARIRGNPAAAPAYQMQTAEQPQISIRLPQYVVPVAGIGLALVTVLAGAMLLRHHSQTQAPGSVSVAQPAVQPQPKTKPSTPQPNPPIQQPAQKSAPTVSNQGPVPSVAPASPPENQSEAASASQAALVRGAVVHQVLPDAPQRARNTIQGKVRVSVKVHVDESGNVTEAAFDSRGPSQYFADRVLQAAQQWKFRPAQVHGRSVPGDWILKFEIDPTAINVSPTEVTPTGAR